MNYTVFYIFSIVTILASIVVAVLFAKNSRLKSNHFITPFNTLFAGLFVATLLLLVPVYDSICNGTRLHVLKTILFSIQGTFQVFTVDADTSLISENITESVGAIAGAYSATLSVFFVLAPVFTFGFLISFFKNVSAYIKLFFQRGKALYVFSELNEKSLALAADIRKNHPKCALVFTDVFDRNEERPYELMNEADELGAICFKKDILSISLKLHSPSKEMYLFVLGADESENIGQALKLISAYGSIPNAHLYVFTTRIESELLLSHKHGIPMTVRRVNEVRSLVNRVLYERGEILFRHALPAVNNEKKIHAIIVGLGSYGTEMLKALTWYCQMDGYRVEMDVYDKDDLAEERFAALCPELMSDDYNGVYVPGEAEYLIKIHSGVDAETKFFADSISQIKDATYVFVALGSDESNVKTAVNLRMLFERSGVSPDIQTVVINSDESSALKNIRNFKGQLYNIECIGDLKSSCSETVIVNSDLEKAAFEVHKGYCGEDTKKEKEFWEYEYNYNSSMATAIHMKAREKCGIPGANKGEKQWTATEKAVHEPLEHRRWNAYMRAEGYIFSGFKDESSRNDLAKMHHDLVDFLSLSEDEKRKDSRVGRD